MSRLGLFDLDALTVILLGIDLNEGRAPDNFIELDPQAQFEWVESADGLVIRCKTRQRRTPLMVNMLQGCAPMIALGAIHGLDVAAPGGAGVGPFLLKDGNGSTLFTGTVAIDKMPKRTFGRTVKYETLECSLISDPATLIYGGIDSPA